LIVLWRRDDTNRPMLSTSHAIDAGTLLWGNRRAVKKCRKA
jgi:hypothetical protein